MKRKIYIFLMATLILFTGCDSYLDVTPSDKQTADQLFAVKDGFYTALNGIYDELASTSLYGQELTWGALDVMSKRYVAPQGNTAYQDLSSGNFTSTYAAPILSAIWGNAYELILSTNILMEQLENRKEGLLTETEAQLIKGELHAIRAFLHLDMMRLFGPRVEDNPEALAIPYNEDTQIRVLDLLPCTTVIEKIMTDLDKAEKLLATTDPVIEKGPLASEGDIDDDVQMRYRQYRFNYYTVIALKARAYLWGGDKVNALAQAKRLIEDATAQSHFPAVDPNTLIGNNSNPDRVFSSEVLTGIYVKTRDQIYATNFSADAPAAQCLQPYAQFVSNILFTLSMEGSYGPTPILLEPHDYRYLSQWEAVSAAGSQRHVLSKYKSISKPNIYEDDSEYFYSKMIPLVRMQEMYHIAIECEPNPADQLRWFHAARARRGCSPDGDGFIEMLWEYGYVGFFLANEVMREYYGEGQTYYFLKRFSFAAGYPAGMITTLENGAALDYSEIVTPPLPEGEMK